MYKIGIDIGSTTIKFITLNNEGEVVIADYDRHNAAIKEKLTEKLLAIRNKIGADQQVSIHLTGSIGMGISEELNWPFVQEVVAATKYTQKCHNSVATLIDIGGEDAKVVIFNDGKADDLRMNGNCAGGTGAFIDQMAVILGVEVSELSNLALNAKNVYPIASRCGVFSKTDIQNLIAKNVSKEDIAASIFHAVAVQTIMTLAHGYKMRTPLMFIGGPLTYIPALRKAFSDYLNIPETEFILPQNSQLVPAFGCALTEGDKSYTISELCVAVESMGNSNRNYQSSLKPIFTSEQEYTDWKVEKAKIQVPKANWHQGENEVALGIDSGSTTTKIVALTPNGELLFRYYHVNEGNPIKAVEKGLLQMQDEAAKAGATIKFIGSCSTGYGEDLIKAAYMLDHGIIETMAHYVAAKQINPNVSFILDIGGQDMKAMFVDNGTINQVEINEACSSGCGSFISTFANSLGYQVADFAKAACLSVQPCDLGTRCTVFMNSKVKQVLREGATLNDIAAGLSYSVVKNCLYKVLKLKNTNVLGEHIVVQGGTMKNDSVVRAFELLTGRTVNRSDAPELMGAMGCAIYALANRQPERGRHLPDVLQRANYETKQLQCKGCENNCLVQRYTFNNGNHYFSGNRCEKVFNNKGEQHNPGENAYIIKQKLLFDRHIEVEKPLLTLGIPRVLNMFEEYPFWHTLFSQCGIKVLLSSTSTYSAYETGAQRVMSDNICFPAKLVHAHIQWLRDNGAQRVFMPFVVFEKDNGYDANSFNCPVVTGYSQVVKAVDQEGEGPVDSPVITFKENKRLFMQCRDYIQGLGLNINSKTIRRAFKAAIESMDQYGIDLVRENKRIMKEAELSGRPIVLLAGRPYHTDPLIQHKLSNMVAELGCNVITEDIIRDTRIDINDVHFISQWSYPGRILRAAKWSVEQERDILFMQMTSFGCGPDAFLLDEVRDLLHRYNKSLTQLKIDDVNNIGSLKLRVRSALDSTAFALKQQKKNKPKEFVTTPIFGKNKKNQKLIAPFFTQFASPIIPSLLKIAGYDVECLPSSTKESDELGLKYANNEVCYPATLIVGDIIHAFESGKYDPNNTSVAITQTGGQCRATNYISLIKKALVEAGYEQVSVVSLNFGGLENEQPGFKIPWMKIITTVFWGLFYGDVIAKLYYAAKARENKPGAADLLKEKYLNLAKPLVEAKQNRKIRKLINDAVKEFSAITIDKECEKVGIVGEIFLKFHPYAQKGLTQWLIDQGIEVAPPLLIDFFLQSFVNSKVKKNNNTEGGGMMTGLVSKVLFNTIQKSIEGVNKQCSKYKYFTPFGNVFHHAEEAKNVIELQAQFGEGWLLPSEIISYLNQGITHVVSLQPFGCIANHIVSRGITNRLKALYPQLNLLNLDFDSGVSEVNVTNRLLLFTDDLKNK